jgi:xanthine dehydrogenase YagR molybdenum-binding subunit
MKNLQKGLLMFPGFCMSIPNVNTIYKVVPLNVGVPAPMRGPGEATGSFALESALDELSYALNMDPIELGLKTMRKLTWKKTCPGQASILKSVTKKVPIALAGPTVRQSPVLIMMANGW